jgi:transposase-like protein
VTIYRWVRTFTAEFIAAARPVRHAVGDRWFVDEVRHEAPWIRVGVRDLHRRAVAAGRLKLGAAVRREVARCEWSYRVEVDR